MDASIEASSLFGNRGVARAGEGRWRLPHRHAQVCLPERNIRRQPISRRILPLPVPGSRPCHVLARRMSDKANPALYN